MKVGVLGSSGFLGRNLCNVLERHGIDYVGGSRSGHLGQEGTNVNAVSLDSVLNWIEHNKITHIVNLAAVCGGIGLNKKHPFHLWLATTKITSTVLEASVSLEIQKTVMLGTVCSYAANCPVPFAETDLMNHGWPEETNRAYGLSKLNGLIGGQAAAKEHGLDVVNLIPVNMYGPYDHFDLENSHIIPALINKIENAVRNNIEEVEIWGTGRASREFLFAEDCSEAIVSALKLQKQTTELINIGSGVEVSIEDVVYRIARYLNFSGNFRWNHSKPDGQLRRQLDVKKAKSLLKWEAKTSLDDGLKKTIEWYKENICS